MVDLAATTFVTNGHGAYAFCRYMAMHTKGTNMYDFNHRYRIVFTNTINTQFSEFKPFKMQNFGDLAATTFVINGFGASVSCRYIASHIKGANMYN